VVLVLIPEIGMHCSCTKENFCTRSCSCPVRFDKVFKQINMQVKTLGICPEYGVEVGVEIGAEIHANSRGVRPTFPHQSASQPAFDAKPQAQKKTRRDCNERGALLRTYAILATRQKD
jgi:hypothetical protein